MSGLKQGTLARNASLIIVFAESTSYALILPILPFVVVSLGEAAFVGGIIVGCQAASAALFSPILGRYSDKYGRRNAIAVSLGVSVIGGILFALSTNIALLMISRLLAGVASSNIGVLQAAAVEQTSRKYRPKIIGRLSSAWALGFIVGPLISSVTTAGTDVPLSYAGWFTAVLSFGGLSLSLVAYRDSTNTGREQKSRRELLHRIRRPSVFASCILAFIQTGTIAMLGYWALNKYGWQEEEVAGLIFLVAGFIIAAQLIALPALVRGWGNFRSFQAMILLMMIGCVILALSASAGSAIIGSILLFSSLTLAQSLITNMTSISADELEQGLELGILNGAANIGRVFGPVLFGWSFINISSNAQFYISISLCAFVLLIIHFFKYRYR
ncbi:MAG: MFS transporter [Pseudomonadota bacterium]